MPTVLDIMIYLFVYSSKTTPALVAALNMEDAGNIAPASDMGMMIFYTNLVARLVHALVSRYVLGRTQGWRQR